ncbi:MAG: hypothetical protein J0H98_10625 [Solirubrobacterales bacterium]|nr:hypothetical protein [Solirubrobacterales bacterium]
MSSEIATNPDDQALDPNSGSTEHLAVNLIGDPTRAIMRDYLIAQEA